MPLMADRALLQQQQQQVPTVPAHWLRRTLTDYLNQEQDKMPESVRLQLLQWFPGYTVPALLSLLLDKACTSFETSLDFVHAQWNSPLIIIPLSLLYWEKGETFVNYIAEAWAERAFGKEHNDKRLPRPPLPFGPRHWCSHPEGQKWTLYLTCLWRCAVSMLLEHTLTEPWAAHEPDPHLRLRTYRQKMHYFRCTHLDFLSRCGARLEQKVDASNTYWLSLSSDATHKKEPEFTHVYPQCTRVCCAEELPSLVPLFYAVSQWHDMSSRKTNISMRLILAQLYLKTGAHVCMMRGSNDICTQAMAHYPAIQRLVTLVLRAGWLGTLGMDSCGMGAPPLHALMRINASFAPRDALFPHPSPGAIQMHEEMIRTWSKAHPVLTLWFLREHFLYTCESSLVLDRIFGATRKWENFKAVVRMANTTFRRQVAAWLAEYGAGTVPWRILENRRNGAKSSTGEIVKWHAKAKEHNTKLFKGTEHELLLRKMQVEKKEHFDVPAIRAWLEQDGRLEAIKVAAWTAAHQVHEPLPDGRIRPGLPTAILKLLGMSEHGFMRVRAWLHASVEYHTADNAFVLFSREQLWQYDWRDYVILKLYLRLMDVYMDDVLCFTSAEQWRAQKMAQRRNLTIPWGANNEVLGVAHYCEGCNKWAHAVVRPSREYTGLPPAAAQRQRQAGKSKKGSFTTNRTVKHYRRNKQTTKRPRPWLPRPMGLGDGRAHCMTGMALNPLDGLKYCIRGHLDTNKQEAALVAAEAQQEREERERERALLEEDEEEDDDEDSDTEDPDSDDDDDEEDDEDDDDDDDEAPAPVETARDDRRGKKKSE